MQTVTVQQLEAYIERCLVAVGLPETDARIVAELMAEADLSGSDGHGVFRLPQYVKRVRSNGIKVDPNIQTVKDNGAMVLVDGDDGMGHLVMHHATEIAIAKAAEHGVGWVGIRHGNHAGPAALYAKMPMRHDMIGIYIAVGSANHLPPWGGTELLLSTNPIAVAVPAAEEPAIVLDMATTVAAYGKVKTAAQRGEQMPEGWMMDKFGNPLTDPTRAAEGFLLPIGGAKGYGLALIFGLLAGTLNGAAFGREVVDFNADSRSSTNTGQMVVAVSIEAFMAVDEFKRKVDAVIHSMHASPTLPGVDAVRVPGERSHAIRVERERSGIPIYPGLAEKLAELASELGVESLFAAD
ncbi:MAG: Ldh family oxidoreductase [Candidatus Rariloculaceae bacterium]